MRVVSLYTGAGGLDLGFEAAGFDIAVGVEMDASCVQTIHENRSWKLLPHPIQDISSQKILDEAGLEVSETDVLIGGPPCQPFSKSAYWVRGDTQRLNDPRASTLEHFLRVVRDIQPRAFLVENVPGLGYRDKDEGVELFNETVRDINEELGTGYKLSVGVLNAVDFGVPQERRRVFIVGDRGGREFTFPEPTHSRRKPPSGSDQVKFVQENEVRNAWDAIGDLEDDDDPILQLTGKWADLLSSIPEGENYLFHTPRGRGKPLFGWRTRYWSFLLKLAKRLPSWTITAQPGPAIGPFHWKNRRLSTRELARLQGFPDDFQITGTPREAQRQLGNAVPCALAELLARRIRVELLGGRARTDGLSLIPEARNPIPEPEPVAPVPPKYGHLEDDHSPHPGTGRGPGALARRSGS